MPPVTINHIMNVNDILYKLISAIILAGVIVAIAAPTRSDTPSAVSTTPAIALVETIR